MSQNTKSEGISIDAMIQTLSTTLAVSLPLTTSPSASPPCWVAPLIIRPGAISSRARHLLAPPAAVIGLRCALRLWMADANGSGLPPQDSSLMLAWMG